MTTDLKKGKVSYTILCAVPTEIHAYSKMSSIVTLLSSKISTLTEPSISGVLTVVGLSGLSLS